ncbi:hypothetical protein M3204_23550 [Mesobacillus subterraneus]|uniref:hypothetical protein n=1 Tax=Mesobacillus subterraneus TaxID=285983 RepID=UPI00203B8725|nr:hypothetical protein [Mesobacillus subterraneus]MCM3667354.1 hypothetical protein [Mesobacillus subterraneus]MCM3686349.1 hypothetical protein [Mesobacillus subterraneus]
MGHILKKSRGKINEIIYNNTAYYNGKYRYYPTITGLKSILDEIIGSSSTTEYIRITPFYINELLDRQIEFEEYMFFIECRDWFDEKIQEMHILECLDPIDTPRALSDLRLGAILYPLCQKNDVDYFKNALQKYKDTLNELLLKMMDIAKLEMNLKEGHLPFGYFCFEIHSG